MTKPTSFALSLSLSARKSFVWGLYFILFWAPMANTQSDDGTLGINPPFSFSQTPNGPDISIFQNNDNLGNANGNLALLDSWSPVTTDPSSEFLTSSVFDPSNVDLFADPSSSIPPANFLADNSPDDFFTASVGDDLVSPKCISGSSTNGNKNRKIRSRTDSCNAGDMVEPLPSYSAVSSSAYAQNRKKWCSQTEGNEFGNIPVCDMNPPPRESGADLGILRNQVSLNSAQLINIYTARISKSFLLGSFFLKEGGNA